MGEGADAEFMDHMQTMTGLSFKQIPPTLRLAQTAKESETAQPEPTTRDALLAMTRLARAGAHAGLRPMASIRCSKACDPCSPFPNSPARSGRLRRIDPCVLELAHDPVSRAPVLWLLPDGEGQIIVSAYGSIFTNKVLGEDDNARLLANIVRWSLRGDGQGHHRRCASGAGVVLRSRQVLRRFAPASHAAVAAGACGWCSCSGSQRLRGGNRSWNPLDITGFVRATGGFMARVMRPAAVGSAAVREFLQRVAQPTRPAARRRARVGLAGAHTRCRRSGSRAPAGTASPVQQGRRVDSRELHNLLVRIRAPLN